MGLVFLAFGVLKFLPGREPRRGSRGRDLRTPDARAGPWPGRRCSPWLLETTIGVLLLTGWLPRLALALLGVALVGILSPLVLLTGDLFAGPLGAPTLEGQYVLKDVVLAAGALVDRRRDAPPAAPPGAPMSPRGRWRARSRPWR